jgi:putative DNA primase/helicase
LTPVEFDEDAPCPLWLGFLERIFDRKQALIDYVQRAVGYSMTGSTREQCWFLGYGRGQNGKTTFRECVKAALGDYAAVTESRTFLQERYEGVRNDLARLPGVRYLTCMETESGKKLAEGLVKLVTGGDTISARFLFHESFEFKPVFKLWLSANHKPRITGTDYATWRRIRLLDFSVTIPEDERDPDLLETLQQELSGILSWAVLGCRDWQRHGLGTPEEVTQATEDFRIEQDTLGAFIAECCEEDADAYVMVTAIYKAYEEWCKESGEKPLTKRDFSISLSEKGYGTDRKYRGRCRLGLRLQ